MEEQKLTLSQLEQYLSKAAWILKGPVDASDFKVYIFPLLFFKRISDVYNEEYQAALDESDGDNEYAALPEMHRFEIPKGCHWQDVRETSTNVGAAIENALRGIEQANQEFLYGIFGDAQWSNKNKLTDALLINLIEHFSQYTLGRNNAAPDILGNAYEYLIKHFADLTNKKAGEFYTPRSVVHLLGMILEPHEGETIYDPACGTGGMLLECVDHLKDNKEDYRTLKLNGQEKNLTSSAIARMNMFLHAIDDFNIVRGDTLRNPAFFAADGLQTFDCVIANPPFSLKEWGAENWADDPFGRNIAGVPPNGERPKFKSLSQRLEELRDKAEKGLIASIDFVKELCKIAKETLQAEKELEQELQEKSPIAALTELFLELKTDQTPAVVERIVEDIDAIVRIVRFPGWQKTSGGEREVQKSLRKALLKYKLHKDQTLFERAYAYIKEYY